MPAIPDITGGAGKGSFNIENKTPTNAPVTNANKTSAIITPIFLSDLFFSMIT